jgi:hypothetical protein
MQRGVGYPLQLLEVDRALDAAVVFADVIEGAARPATVRVRTTARTNVLFMGSPGTTSTLVRENLVLPDVYNLRGR